MARPRIRLLIPNDPHPMRIERDLANEIGLNESIVLLQLEYLIGIGNNERDGQMWTYQSLHDLHEVYFPWWSVMTISRIVKSLEEMKLITIGNYNKLGYDRTQWYALNPVGIAKLTSILLHTNAIYQNDTPIYQNDDMDSNKMINGSQQIDTTIPETTQRVHKRESAHEHAPRVSPAPRQKTMDSFNQAVLSYKELSGKKHIAPATNTLIADRVTDVDRWREIIPVWAAAGFNLSNITGLLDWYDHPEKMAAHIARNKAPRQNGYKPDERVAPTVGLSAPKTTAPPDAQPSAEAAANMLRMRNR